MKTGFPGGKPAYFLHSALKKSIFRSVISFDKARTAIEEAGVNILKTWDEIEKNGNGIEEHWNNIEKP